ncbi:MAG: DNA gyrase inhibitor YacG [Sedimentisphaerales bacterium]|nr:DNA gyrase inhibitor YacG [Sedimentisphaerales bacterium]
MEHTCPICHKIINSTGQEKGEKNNFYPFCSERCKLLDLGSWLDANYKVLSAQKSIESDQDFDLPE